MAWAAPKTDALLARYDSLSGSYRWRLWLMVRGRLAISGGLFGIYIATQVAQPLLLRRTMFAVENDEAHGFAYAIAVGVAGACGSLVKEQQLFINLQLGAELRAVTAGLLFRRAMRVKQAELPRSLSNLFTIDAQKLLEFLPQIHMFWGAPLLITIAAFLIVDIAGGAALAGVLVLFCLVPINQRLVRWLRTARRKHLPLADLRVSRCVEMVKAVRVLKFNGWDEHFERAILRDRAAEMPYVRAELRYWAYSIGMTIALPQIATMVALAARVLSEPSTPLAAAVAFPTLSLFSIIRFPLMVRHPGATHAWGTARAQTAWRKPGVAQAEGWRRWRASGWRGRRGGGDPHALPHSVCPPHALAQPP